MGPNLLNLLTNLGGSKDRPEGLESQLKAPGEQLTINLDDQKVLGNLWEGYYNFEIPKYLFSRNTLAHFAVDLYDKLNQLVPEKQEELIIDNLAGKSHGATIALLLCDVIRVGKIKTKKRSTSKLKQILLKSEIDRSIIQIQERIEASQKIKKIDTLISLAIPVTTDSNQIVQNKTFRTIVNRIVHFYSDQDDIISKDFISATSNKFSMPKIKFEPAPHLHQITLKYQGGQIMLHKDLIYLPPAVFKKLIEKVKESGASNHLSAALDKNNPTAKPNIVTRKDPNPTRFPRTHFLNKAVITVEATLIMALLVALPTIYPGIVTSLALSIIIPLLYGHFGAKES